MNIFRRPAPTRSVPAHAMPAPIATRSAHPARDFGIGYGCSSGYATGRRYAPTWAPERFRCA